MKRLPYIFIGVLILAVLGGIVWFQEKPIGAVSEISKNKLEEKYNLATEIKAKYQIDNASLVKIDIKNYQ